MHILQKHFHFLSFSFIFCHFLSFSIIFCHFLSFSVIFFHFLSVSFSFFQFLSVSCMFFHFLSFPFFLFFFFSWFFASICLTISNKSSHAKNHVFGPSRERRGKNPPIEPFFFSCLFFHFFHFRFLFQFLSMLFLFSCVFPFFIFSFIFLLFSSPKIVSSFFILFLFFSRMLKISGCTSGFLGEKCTF